VRNEDIGYVLVSLELDKFFSVVILLVILFFRLRAVESKILFSPSSDPYSLKASVSVV